MHLQIPEESSSQACIGPSISPQCMQLLTSLCCIVGVAGYAMYGNKTLEEVTMNLRAGPMQLAATSLILVSPFTKFALTLEPVARGVEEFVQKVDSSLACSPVDACVYMWRITSCTCSPIAAVIQPGHVSWFIFCDVVIKHDAACVSCCHQTVPWLVPCHSRVLHAGQCSYSVDGI